MPVDSFAQPDSGDGPSGHLAKHLARADYTQNWKNDKAVDLKTQGLNLVVRAAESGTVCGESWCCLEKNVNTDVYGKQFELRTDSGTTLFYTHVGGDVPCGQRVAKGQVIGYVATGANVNHLHLSIKSGDVCTYLRGCKSMSGASAGNMLATCM